MSGVSAGFQEMYGLCVGTVPGTGPAFPQGSVISRIKVFQNSATITPPAQATISSTETTYATQFTGLTVGDLIFGWTINVAVTSTGAVISNMRVTATNTIGITITNASAGSSTFQALTAGQLTIYVVNVDTF